MTNQRARAFVVIKELPCDIYFQDGDTMLYVNEFLTPENAAVVCAEFNAVLTAALADERRRGMEEAAKVAKDFDRLTCAEMKEKYGLVLDVRRLDIGENVARCILAKAHAGQEG